MQPYGCLTICSPPAACQPEAQKAKSGPRRNPATRFYGPVACGLWRVAWRCLAPQEAEHRLRLLIRLSEHAGAGLLEHLELREVGHFRRHVDVADLALRGGEV